MSDDLAVAVQEIVEAEVNAEKSKVLDFTAAVTKKKKPVRVVSGDAYRSKGDDGEWYHEHAGETVTFKSAMGLGGFLSALDIQSLSGMNFADVDGEESAEARSLFLGVCQSLSEAIVGWTWTDSADNALASPPSAALIATLPIEEIMWLVGVSMGGNPAVGDAGEASSS